MPAFKSRAFRAAEQPMTTRLTRLAGLCGIVSPIVTLTLIFVAIAQSPWFSWHDNALSDMGISQTPNSFNAALLIGGVMYLMFVAGFFRWLGLTSPLSQLAAWLMLAGGIGLTLISIITEAAGSIHDVVAAAYFFVTPLAYALFGIDLFRRGVRLRGALTIAAGVAALLFITVVPHRRIAVPEILAAVIIAAWTFSTGMMMSIEPEKEHEQAHRPNS
jgi:hypothetical membrane protein